MNREGWIWLPHAGHLIVGNACRFHLTTVVSDGAWLVSTVGEWWPDREVRKIHADVRGITIEGRGDYWDADYMRKCGYMEIGLDRLYETMVFRAIPHDEGCCLWRQADGSDRDFEGYNDAGEAYRGHIAMCEKWSGIAAPIPEELLA